LLVCRFWWAKDVANCATWFCTWILLVCCFW